MPVAPTIAPSAKMAADTSYCPAWECGASQWTTPEDSTWTVFHGLSGRFLIDTTAVRTGSVLISEYLSNTSMRHYRSKKGVFSVEGDSCFLRIQFAQDDIIRIYEGEVKYLYRGSTNARFNLIEGDDSYQIARVRASGAVEHIDFWSFHHRNNKPPSLEDGDRAYYPVNFDVDAVNGPPEDDRDYLLNVLEECEMPMLVAVETTVPRTPPASGSSGNSSSNKTGDKTTTQPASDQTTNTNTTPEDGDKGQNDPPAPTETPELKTPKQQTDDEVDEKLPPPTVTYFSVESVRFISDTDDPPVAASQNEELTDCDEYYATHGHTLGYHGTDYGCEERYCGEYFSGTPTRQRKRPFLNFDQPCFEEVWDGYELYCHGGEWKCHGPYTQTPPWLDDPCFEEDSSSCIQHRNPGACTEANKPAFLPKDVHDKLHFHGHIDDAPPLDGSSPLPGHTHSHSGHTDYHYHLTEDFHENWCTPLSTQIVCSEKGNLVVDDDGNYAWEPGWACYGSDPDAHSEWVKQHPHNPFD